MADAQEQKPAPTPRKGGRRRERKEVRVGIAHVQARVQPQARYDVRSEPVLPPRRVEPVGLQRDRLDYVVGEVANGVAELDLLRTQLKTEHLYEPVEL